MRSNIYSLLFFLVVLVSCSFFYAASILILKYCNLPEMHISMETPRRITLGTRQYTAQIGALVVLQREEQNLSRSLLKAIAVKCKDRRSVQTQPATAKTPGTQEGKEGGMCGNVGCSEERETLHCPRWEKWRIESRALHKRDKPRIRSTSWQISVPLFVTRSQSQ